MLLGVLNQRHLFIRDQVCRGTNQLELRGRGNSSWDFRCVSIDRIILIRPDLILGVMWCRDKAGERRYLLWINNLNSLKCIIIVHMTHATLPVRTIKKETLGSDQMAWDR